jgi:hypothetical protein
MGQGKNRGKDLETVRETLAAWRRSHGVLSATLRN